MSPYGKPGVNQKVVDLATAAKEINDGEAFVSVVNEDVFEFAILPAFRALRRQMFGGSCVTEEEETRALEYWKSTGGEKLRACLYDYVSVELMRKSASITEKLKNK
jgi:hypothetical protein